MVRTFNSLMITCRSFLHFNLFFFPVETVIVPSLVEESDLSHNDITEEKALSDSDHESQKYCCQRCGRTYFHHNTMARHLRYECGIPASHPCPLCGKKFKRSDVVMGHLERCRGKKRKS